MYSYSLVLRNGKDAIAEELRAGQYFVNHRWLGGTLTNWDTIQNVSNVLRKSKQWTGFFRTFTKKEVALLKKQQENLKILGGIEHATHPRCTFVVDPRKEQLLSRKHKN